MMQHGVVSDKTRRRARGAAPARGVYSIESGRRPDLSHRSG